MKKIISLILSVCMVLLIAACGNNGGGGNSESVSSSTGNTGNNGSPAAGTSGKVVAYMPSPADMNEKIASAFTAKTGIEVELYQGTTGEILARLETEKENPIADVVVLASWADGLAMKDDDQLLEYVPENADKVYDDWKDADHMLYGTSASALGVIYNTTIVESLSADWNELSDSQYTDLLAIPDPQKSGSCKDFLAGFIYANGDASWSVWEGMAANNMTVPGANKAALEAVTTGEKAILAAGVDYNAYDSMAKGEPLDIYYPASGTVINPRPAMILKTSPNQDNAKAFLDFLLSDEAQQLVADAYLLPGRSDILCENRTNVSDIPVFELDWTWMMDNSEEIANKLLDLCE